MDKYVDLLKRLKKEVPELDDIQVYTFDQEAWIANEFGNGPTDREIPLTERLPAFLQTLTKTWAELSPQRNALVGAMGIVGRTDLYLYSLTSFKEFRNVPSFQYC